MKLSLAPFPAVARLLGAMIGLGCVTGTLAAAEEMMTPPKIGQRAPAFALRTLDDKIVELSRLVETRPVVLVVLRGWPGYQCPLCTRQVREFAGRAGDFAARKARVVFVYPGPAEQLVAHAREFLGDREWPAEFLFVLDPDFVFTRAYALRWEAPKETAFPATFVIDRAGIVRFAQVSKTHGGRVSAADALLALDALPDAAR